ncbi:polysaccharide biosynthesis/export family protein [Falsiroseomonas oryziterrae]|uniref:polysaccharide biosynthesis/export family protein n=1 Tax=Falsiroseomonas oryziterrae TaxID=2911368 RepID=UPI001F3E5127|nr:polysaccharide biosynthesis/export family protein [Roseomonas sp. NPKOSM-4]
MATRRLALFLPLAALAACTSPTAGLPPLPETETGFRLGPEDQVRVQVFNDPRLTGEFRITDEGTLPLPLVGSVPAAGRTTTEVERAVERVMTQRNLFREPQVSIQVLEYRPVFVTGMVERGGRFPYTPGMTALSAVAVAGGFNYRALRDSMTVTRIGPDGRAQEFRATREARILPGDVVTVHERRF